MTDKRGSKASRRTVLWTGVRVVAITLIPVKAGAQPKIAPKLVQYQEKPKGPQECDNCLHFVAPSSCKMVEGKINPKGWCQLYAPKPMARRAAQRLGQKRYPLVKPSSPLAAPRSAVSKTSGPG